MTVPIPQIPTPVPQSSDLTNFDARADALFTALPGVVDAQNSQNIENNAINANVNAKAQEAATAATNAASAAAAVAANASNAASASATATQKATEASASAGNAAAAAAAAAASAGGAAAAVAGSLPLTGGAIAGDLSVAETFRAANANISDQGSLALGSWASIQENGFWDAGGNFLHNAIKKSGANDTWVYRNNGFAARYKQLNGAHYWYTAPSGAAGAAIAFSLAMALDMSGTLLMGVTSPLTTNTRLNVAPGTSNGSAIALQANNGVYGAHFGNTSGTSQYYPCVFANNGFGSTAGSIGVSGTTTSFNTSSDYRLKNITGPITTSGAYIDSLNPVEGTWKADGSTFVGLIAHEAQEASRTPVATGVKDGKEMQGMDYSSAEIIGNMIAELKSLRARLAAAGIA